jgi:broad specificity phosphatase PhoE
MSPFKCINSFKQDAPPVKYTKAHQGFMKIVAFFIRHGETDFNDKSSQDKTTGEPVERFRGDIDVPLNGLGIQQSQELLPYFAAREFSAAFHSGMQRTAQTMEPLMEDKGMEATAIEGLNGLDTGDFAGQPKSEKNKKKLEHYRENPDERIPGGETVQEFRDRVDPKLQAAIKIGEEAGKPSVVCVHGSVMRELSRLLHDDYNKVKVEPGGVIGVFKSPYGYEAKALLKDSQAEEDIRAGS